MSTFSFSTCDRRRALGFLKTLYPACVVEDSGTTKELLDLVEKDILRIDDPMMHNPAQVRLGKNCDPSQETAMIAVCQRFHDAVLASEVST